MSFNSLVIFLLVQNAFQKNNNNNNNNRDWFDSFQVILFVFSYWTQD